jgi:putative ABC transport system permease protein
MRFDSTAAHGGPAPRASWVSDLRRDIPYSVRALQRTPAFTLLCILTIAVGIGANAAIFSVVNEVLLRPLPYAEPDRLVRVWESLKDHADWTGSISVPNLRDWQAQSKTVQHFVAYQFTDRILDGGTEPERLMALEATANMFAALGIKPLAGRTFAANEDLPGQNRVVVLAENFWRRRFAGDRNIVGTSITLSGVPHVVVGVMPAAFAFPASYLTNDIWIPYTATEPNLSSRGNHFLNVVAQLRPGVSLERASAEMKDIAARIETANPKEQTNRTVLMVPLHESMVGRIKPALLMLLGSVAMVLLIACANVANLLLARGATRRRDVAVRLALGASRAQLIRQYLTESTLLALAGALVGTAVAYLALKPLTTLAANALPVGGRIEMDAPVLGFLLLASVLSGLVFGLAPALQTSSKVLRGDLVQSADKQSSGTAQQRARSVLAVTQIALSLVLLIGAALMIRGFLTLRGMEVGFDAERLVTMRLSVPRGIPDSLRAQAVYRPVLEQVRGVAGVESAGMISMLPIDSWGTNGDFWVDGKPKPEPGKAPITELRQVTPGYFKTMGIAVKSGRDFTDADGIGGINPVLVNEAMARQHFAGTNPVGQAIRRGDGADSRFTIVGVVGDVRSGGLERAATPETYFPYGNYHQSYGTLVLVVRTRLPEANMIAPLRASVNKAAPGVPVFAVRSMDEIIGRSLAARRLNLALMAIFSGIALLLAASGLYGVISYLVAQRTREIGIRMALGADRARVVRLVVRQGMFLAIAGIFVGMGGAFALSRIMGGLLYGVGARDPVTFASAPLLLGGVALLATMFPALRASRVNPMLAIRSE